MSAPGGDGRTPLLHVALIEPEIPPNTGSIARLCAANAVRLHLVEPLGFRIDDKHLRRAGLDYWPHVDLRVHPRLDDFLVHTAAARSLFYSARAARRHTDVHHRAGDFLVFGGESRGLPAALLEAHRTSTFSIAMRTDHVRSLNLSNAVSVVVYEALRQLDGGAMPLP
jgi:tRNA (cytidine/uridine-2'-O-)-methyltransferase